MGRTAGSPEVKWATLKLGRIPASNAYNRSRQMKTESCSPPVVKGRSWRHCQEQFLVSVRAENRLRYMEQGPGKAEREALKGEQSEARFPHLFLLHLQSPGWRMCTGRLRGRLRRGLSSCLVQVLGEGLCDSDLSHLHSHD